MLLQAGPHRLWVCTAGPASGPPVLLLHGFPDDHTVWDAQVEALAAEGYRCIAPNMLGIASEAPGAASDTPASVGAYTLAAIAQGLAGLLDTLQLERVTVIGHDWGAAAAWQLALAHPDRVARLAVISVGHPACGAPAGGMEQRKRWWYLFLMADPGAERALAANDWELMRELLAAAAGGASPGQAAATDAAIRRLARPGALTAALAWYRANHHPAAVFATRPRPRAQRARMPVLGVYPAADGALTEGQMVGSARYVPEGGWSYVRLEGAGHWPQRDAPGALNEALLGWLAGGQGAEGGRGAAQAKAASGGGGLGAPRARL